MSSEDSPSPHSPAVQGGTAQSIKLMVGSYRERGGEGLYPLVRSGAGEWSPGPSSAAANNTSAGIYTPRFDLHYLADESEPGVIGAYALQDGALVRLAGWGTAGDAPCHVALDEAQTRLAVANYGSGSVSIFTLDDATGAPGARRTVQLSGYGPNAERQEGPHAHWVGFGPAGQLYVVDLGSDAISILPDHGSSVEVAFRAPPGSGARQLLFHPRLPVAYLVSEMASSLTALDVADDGRLSARSTISTLPDDFSGESLGGHILINGACDRLYVTNRGHDSIAVFTLDSTGDAKLLQHAATGGRSPRFMFALEDSGEMLVAHEESGDVRLLRILEDGMLRLSQASFTIPGAVFLFPVAS